MSEADKAEKRRVVISGLHKLGFEIKQGKRHDTATCPRTNKKTTIPRHKQLNKYTVGSIYDFLIESGYSAAEVRKAFKWPV